MVVQEMEDVEKVLNSLMHVHSANEEMNKDSRRKFQ